MPNQNPSGPRPPQSRSHAAWVIVGAIFLALLIADFAVSSHALGTTRVQIPYRPTFIQQVRHGNVTSITSQGDSIEGTVDKPVTANGHSATAFTTQVPSFANKAQLSTLLQKHNVTINAQPVNNGPGALETFLVGFGPVILLALLAWFLFRRMRGAMGGAGAGAGGISSFGRSRARRAEGKNVNVTFDDVAGIDEAKADLTEIVEFLKDPKKFSRLGGHIPRGVLLTGAPGTGKTLLARAVAGQANVPFFQVSASEFVEMIVGVGASRVRDLFKQAKDASPAIVFIDELDAIGRKRGAASGMGGGSNDEREQTLNQILTEMDGFEPGEGVIVIAATNRPEILDPALMRPGRFDRRVAVAAPDKRGRRKILDVHTKGIPLAGDVDLEALAAQTPGMVGADLANLVNEAALTAARNEHQEVQMSDFGESLEKILLGAERNTLMTPEERRRIAYHEGGHAIVGMLTDLADPVRKVTIIPRGRSLGVTFAAPDADQYNLQKEYLLARVRVALGGRVAEELVFGNITSGAESDIQQLTQIARQMVGRWGMSDKIGPIAVLPSEAEGPLLPGASEVSPETQREIDAEVRRIISEAHAEVAELLREHRSQLDSLAAKLLEEETLDEREAYEAAGLEPPEHPGREAQQTEPGEEPEPVPEAPVGIGSASATASDRAAGAAP